MKDIMMELWPTLKFGLLNGWLAVVALGLAEGICFALFPKDVVKRLWDRSGWSQKQVIFTVIGKVCALGGIILLLFTPLKIGHAVFWVGLVVGMAGVIGLVTALVNFRNTPFGQPVERGIYKISRHPQIVMATTVLLSGAIAIGSWPAVLLLIAARIMGHFGIVAEEEVCLKKYGAAYQAYMERIPRYFIVF